MKYFENFPTISYPYMGKMVNNDSGFFNSLETVDLTLRFKIVDDIAANPSAYMFYSIGEGERPDTIAKKVYKDANLSWVVMLSAGIFDWGYDLPMTNKAFSAYMFSKYNKTEYELANIVHHYETSRGYVIDSLTFSSLLDAGKKVVSIYDYENELNDERRIIKLISPVYIPTIIKEYESKLKLIKSNRKLTGNT